MGSHEIVIEPHELTIAGTVIYLQGDPTSGEGTEWEALLEQPRAVGTRNRDKLLEAFSKLAETESDAETLLKLKPGGATLNNAVEWYIGVVTGFPLVPSGSLKPSSKRTGKGSAGVTS